MCWKINSYFQCTCGHPQSQSIYINQDYVLAFVLWGPRAQPQNSQQGGWVKIKLLKYSIWISGPFSVLTVSLTGSRTIIRAEPGLHLLLAQLQKLGAGEQRPADVPVSLLLPWPILTNIHRHPWCPGGVAAHLRASLQITGLIFLEDGQIPITINTDETCKPIAAAKAPATVVIHPDL